MKASGYRLEVDRGSVGGSQRSGPSLGYFVRSYRAAQTSIHVVHRYPFSSSLKRMSVIADVRHRTASGVNCSSLFIFTKGAPEILADPSKKFILPAFLMSTKN